MTAHLFQCPSCGAPLIPHGGNPTTNCPYCNLSVVVPEELRQVSRTAPWSTLLFDGFVSNVNNWSVGTQEPDKYFSSSSRIIAEGRYRWEAVMISPTSSIITDWLTSYYVSDFHLIINCKHIRGSRAGSSCGVIFRIQDNRNYYCFHITDHQFFAVAVINDGEWTNLVDWTRDSIIKPNGVNQLEVIAHQAHFTFLINGQIVSEMDDNQFAQGLTGLAVDGFTPGEEITFDFLDMTLRAP